jgi:D-beta-D-heptose 7-phosphate kinase/D-beta-D-heptose 1-phosphate adenosyltransferase
LLKIKPKRILVIGDSFLDEYIDGEAHRLSQEAPVPVVLVSTPPSRVLGGAANTAANIKSLGGEVNLLTRVGHDLDGDYFTQLCIELGVKLMAYYDKHKTSKKLRIRARGQQLLRLDYEDVSSTLWSLADEYTKTAVAGLIGAADAVVISDYAKGFITVTFLQEIVELCRHYGKLLIVDPKPKNKLGYRNVSYITPNESEMLGMMPGWNNSTEAALAFARENQCGVLLTKGADGITLISGGEVKGNWPTQAKEVFDVTGAGDTVVAAFALALASGGTEEEAIVFANKAAGIAVAKHGTTAVKLEEVK